MPSSKRKSKRHGGPRASRRSVAGSTRAGSLKGFNYGQSTSYQNPTTDAFTRELKHLAPAIGFNHSRGGTAFFELQVGSAEYVRFLNRPIFVQFRGSIPNAFRDQAAGAPAKAAAARYALNATDTPGLAINPAHDVASFFTHATVSLDNHEVTTHLTNGGHGFLYNAVNAIFSTRENRTRDNTTHLFHTSHEREIDSAAYKFASRGLFGADWTDEGHSGMRTCSLDGYPLLSLPLNNALANLSGVSSSSNTQCFLPPGTKVSIQLHFRPNMGDTLEWCNESDVDYFATTYSRATAAPTAAAPTVGRQFKSVAVEPLKVFLGYESFIPKDPGRYHDKMLAGSPLRMHMDYPLINTYLVPPNLSHCETDMQVPAGAKFGAIGYVWSHQLWPSGAHQRNLSAKFAFPPHLTNMRVTMRDHGTLVDDLGRMVGEGSLTNMKGHALYSYLRDMGITDDNPDLFIPPGAGGVATAVSYQSLIPLDLRPFKLAIPTDLRVTTEFGEANHLSPTGLFLVSIFVIEGKLERGPGRTWKISPLLFTSSS